MRLRFRHAHYYPGEGRGPAPKSSCAAAHPRYRADIYRTGPRPSPGYDSNGDSGILSIANVRLMCSNALMRRSTSATTTLATLATMAAMSVLSGCSHPISDAEKLKAIRAEAQALMKTHQPEQPSNWKEVSEGQWPATIASLDPESVTVHRWGVDIVTKAYFDGGYGYEVPRSKADLPMPALCYSEPGQGVFWHGPC